MNSDAAPKLHLVEQLCSGTLCHLVAAGWHGMPEVLGHSPTLGSHWWQGDGWGVRLNGKANVQSLLAALQVE